MVTLCGFAGLPLTHNTSRSMLPMTTLQPHSYRVPRRPRHTLSGASSRAAVKFATPMASQGRRQQPPSPDNQPDKILAFAAAAIVLAAPFAGLHTPPPALAASINSAPLRFSQSLLHDEEDSPVKLQAQWDVKSINSQTETFLMFSNDSGSVVDLWWIDYFGHEVYYASINPGTTHMQPSYATHPWVVRDHISQNSVLVLVAGPQPALAVVESV